MFNKALALFVPFLAKPFQPKLWCGTVRRWFFDPDLRSFA
jgi:hypothetical protein